MAKIITEKLRLMVISLSAIVMSCGVANAQEIVSSSLETQTNTRYKATVVRNLQQEVARRQVVMQQKAKDLLLSLPNNEKLYDEGDVSIQTSLTEESGGTGKLNYNFVISYNCKNIEGQTDDYRAGAYNYTESNACRAICTLTKQFVENDCRDIFTSGKKVLVKITSSTDASPVSEVPYKGEYGDFRYVQVFYNDKPTRISVNMTEGIVNNAQLAFLRGQSVKNYLETAVDNFRNTDNSYEFYTKSYEMTGSQYRRCSIELTVLDAFSEKRKSMLATLEEEDPNVDINIPVNPADNNNTFVLIIANDRYDTLFPHMPYVANDAYIFREYCLKTLGVPERQLKMLQNVNKSKIANSGVKWLQDLMKVTRGKGKIIIYYAGYGILDASNAPYILPADVCIPVKGSLGKEPLSKKNRAKLVEQSLAITELCSMLTSFQAQSVTLFLDANFNGVQRDGDYLFPPEKKRRCASTKKPKALRIRGDVVVFSSSDFGATSYAFKEQEHGFFTYFLLKELKQSKGNLSYDDMFTNVKDAVSFESSLQGLQQIPIMISGGKTKDTWTTMTFK